MSHTAFTKRIPLVDFMCEVLNAAEKCRRGEEIYHVKQLNENTALNAQQRSILDKSLKGIARIFERLTGNQVEHQSELIHGIHQCAALYQSIH